MRLDDYAGIVVQSRLLAQCLALQLVYCDIQAPRKLGLQATLSTMTHVKHTQQMKQRCQPVQPTTNMTCRLVCEYMHRFMHAMVCAPSYTIAG